MILGIYVTDDLHEVTSERILESYKNNVLGILTDMRNVLEVSDVYTNDKLQPEQTRKFCTIECNNVIFLLFVLDSITFD